MLEDGNEWIKKAGPQWAKGEGEGKKEEERGEEGRVMEMEMEELGCLDRPCVVCLAKPLSRG